MAYDAASGVPLWVKRYDGTTNFDVATCLAVSPDGSRIFVAEFVESTPSHYDYATVAYETSTGARLWAKGYDGPSNLNDVANAIGLSPDGSQVFVTGRSDGESFAADYLTVSYDTSTGDRVWTKRYEGGTAYALAVSPDGAATFVTGGRADYATVAYGIG